MNAARDQSDAVLIQRWQHGDAAAFEALVRRWQQPMARFLTRLTGRPERVPDLCQELFLRVFLAAPRYRENGNFSTWLYRIALNLARDASRRQRRDPVALADHEPYAREIAPEVECQQRELAEAVTAALDELPPTLREVLVLRHYERLSFEEMARLLSVPASTLKSRFTAALTRLREVLRPWDDTNKESSS
jgi:RNA polymerase sigma-70 factor, ECF subfamily